MRAAELLCHSVLQMCGSVQPGLGNGRRGRELVKLCDCCDVFQPQRPSGIYDGPSLRCCLIQATTLLVGPCRLEVGHLPCLLVQARRVR